MRRLRGERYRCEATEWIAREIESTLFTLDYEETAEWYWTHGPKIGPKEAALLGCNDRYFLLTNMLGRMDMCHPWLFDRCREVEQAPDGYVDLWARGHGKSSIITTAGAIQEIMCDPEITIAIFSVIKPTAIEFLGQIKNEFENNDKLKASYPDVLYGNPRGRGTDGRPPKWGTQRGITVKRKGRPKEATVEAHGLIDGQPTGRHFRMHIYDDVVTQDNLTDELLKKTTLRFEMADNLGTRHGVRKWIAGTRYHFMDAYGAMIDNGSAKPRIYPATFDGTLATSRTLRDGTVGSNLVLLTTENWDRIKRDQSKVVSAQMLLNPIAGSEATFNSLWLRPYEVIPDVLNVYVLIDPSKGKGERSDRSAIAVIGVDLGGNKYLLDGVRHRMKLSERWDYIKQFKRKWEAHPGVQMVRIGYEQYGMLSDIEVMQDLMTREKNHFEIIELATPKTGRFSKPDRIERLEPDIRDGRFCFPCVAYHRDFGDRATNRLCYWSLWTPEKAAATKAAGEKRSYSVGQIVWRSMRGLTRAQERCRLTAADYRIVTAIQRRDESGDIYDLTRVFFEELIKHPFAAHDDLIDAASRIYDLDPQPPTVIDVKSTEPLGIEAEPEGVEGPDDDL